MHRTRARLSLLLLLAVAACVGTKAREKVLMPAVAGAWKGVRSDIDKGIADAKEAGDLTEPVEAVLQVQLDNFDKSIEAEDRVALGALRPAWPSFRKYAERGITRRIKDGEIGVGVSQSLLLRLAEFEDAFTKLTDR